MTNNAINNNQNGLSFIDSLLEESNKAFEEAVKLTDDIRENRKNIIENDTAFAAVVASSGYIAVTFGSMDGGVQIMPVIGKPEKMTSAAATLAGAFTALDKLKDTDKTHITLYVSDYESRRISGMISRINTGDNHFLTDKEKEFIDARPTQFGEFYVANAKKLFMALATTKQKFNKVVRIAALSSVHGYAINRGFALPQSLAGKKAMFRNGRATVADNGRNYAIVISNGTRLNGEHKLAVQNNTLCVEKEVTPGSEAEFAQKLWTISTRLVRARAIKESAEMAGIVAEG